MDKLTADFEKSLFNDSIDIIGDYIEIGIDSFIEEGILEEIPFVKSIVGVLKIGKNVHDRNLLRQTLIFIKEFNSGNISKDKLVAYKSTIENNPKKCEAELGRILLLLNNFIDIKKSIMLSRIFKAYINEKINWNTFCDYAEVINRIFMEDVELLFKIYNDEKIELNGINIKYKIGRLNSLGIINVVYANTWETISSYSKVEVNHHGKIFIEIIK